MLDFRLEDDKEYESRVFLVAGHLRVNSWNRHPRAGARSLKGLGGHPASPTQERLRVQGQKRTPGGSHSLGIWEEPRLPLSISPKFTAGGEPGIQ